MNTFGNIFRLTTAGESHGPAITAIIDGMPAGVAVNPAAVQAAVDRRRPGSGGISSARNEADRVHILSGVLDGVTTGTPIALLIENLDQRPSDYDHLRDVYRPSHADYTYQMKYGIRDHRGGGRSSARETAMRVAAGALAEAALAAHGIRVHAFTRQVGSVALTKPIETLDFEQVYSHRMRCPDAETDAEMERLARHVAEAGDTVGGIIGGVITGLPAGLGEPVYGKFQAMLASAMLSINAVKGFDYGMGFDGVSRLGSEMNDRFVLARDGRITTITNHSGGIQGGITNGRAVTFRVAFKPVATLMRETMAITADGREVTLHPHGRHDSCVVPRAVPVVAAMAAITTLDALLMARASRI